MSRRQWCTFCKLYTLFLYYNKFVKVIYDDHTQRHVLYGIMSYSAQDGCASSNIFVYIPTVIDWIRSVTGMKGEENIDVNKLITGMITVNLLCILYLEQTHHTVWKV